MKKLITTIAIIAGLSLNTAHANQKANPDAKPNAKLQTTTKSTISTADKPSQASVVKLMQVMQLEKSLAQMQDTIKPQLVTMINQSIAQAMTEMNKKSPTAKQQAQLEILLEQYVQEDIDTIITTEFQQQILAISTKITQDTYTQAEVDAMIEFYDSEVGQSILTKQNTYATKLMTEIIPLMTSSINRHQPKDRQAKLFGEIERIMSSK